MKGLLAQVEIQQSSAKFRIVVMTHAPLHKAICVNTAVPTTRTVWWSEGSCNSKLFPNTQQGKVTSRAETSLRYKLSVTSCTSSSIHFPSLLNVENGATNMRSRGQFKRDGTRAETRFRLSAKWTSPFKSAGASVQSTTGSRRVRVSDSNAGYTMFRGSVKGTGYPLLWPVSPSLPLPCVTMCHHNSVGLYIFKGGIGGCQRNSERFVM